MSHPEVISKLLKKHIFPLISGSSIELESWESVTKRVKKSGCQISIDVTKALKDAIDLGTATVCLSYCLNSMKNIALMRNLPIRVAKINALLLKLKEKKYGLPPCVTNELDLMMADADYPSEDTKPIDALAANLADAPAPANPTSAQENAEPAGVAAASASGAIPAEQTLPLPSSESASAAAPR